MIGNYVRGWGANTIGWRNTFFLVGLPGIFVALVIFFTLREPPRGMSDIRQGQGGANAGAARRTDADAPQISEVLSLLWAKVSFRHLAFAAG